MLLTVLLLCIGTTVVHGEARLGCPEGTFLFEEYCYHFGRGEVTQMDAYFACKDIWGAELKEESDNEEENNFIKSTLKGMNTTGAVGAWLDNESNFGFFSFIHDYTDWADDPAPAGDGLCQFMSASKEWKWDAQDCDSKQDMIYMCITDAYIKDCYESTCYHISYIPYACEIGEGYQAKIESEDENDFVKQFLREQTTYSVQIDGSDAGTEGTWVFADGEAMTFEDFDDNEPNNEGTFGEDCIVMDYDRDFKWIDDICVNLSIKFLCEEPMSGTVG